MKDVWICFAVMCFVISCAMCGCSKKEEPRGTTGAKDKAEVSTVPQPNPIKEFADRPIGKAKATRQLGDERLDAVDQAVEGQGK